MSQMSQLDVTFNHVGEKPFVEELDMLGAAQIIDTVMYLVWILFKIIVFSIS